MFWGLILKANKKYSQTVTKSFHVSCAALDQSTVTTNDDVQVMLVSDDNAYLLCTLRKGSICQVPLDLNFAEGDKISFSTKGNGIVHLTGYLIPEGDDFGMDESDSDEGEDASAELEKLMGNGKKAKAEKPKKAEAAKAKKDESDSDEEEEGDDDDDDDEEGEEAEGEEDSDGEMEFEEAEDDSDDDDAEEADSDEEVEEPKSKVQKLDKKEKAKQNGTANGKEAPAKEGKKDKKAAAAAQPANEKGQKRVLPGGVVVEELRVGTGMEAKNGKKVQVYYEGRLKTNNKVFDSTKSGPGFKFGLGKGDVIKGWDLGVVGMKVGGKRRLTCPPAVAYGAKGSPPVIPPNSTLVFDVELKNVF